jgi:hypothetical protein
VSSGIASTPGPIGTVTMIKLAVPSLILALASYAAADGPRPAHHTPPPEAIAACAKSKAGDACAFKIHDHDMKGTCKPRHDDASQLVCRGEHMHPPPDGSGSNAP